MSIIYGNLVGGGSSPDTTFILEDEYGNQLVGTMVDELTVFDAVASDIKLGKVAATDSGVVTGTHICE